MKQFVALVIVLAGLSGTAAAGPVLYAFTFNSTSGSPAPTSGSFQWNGASFSSFLVQWDAETFDFTSSANSPGTSGTCAATAADTFLYLTTGTCSPAGASGNSANRQYRGDNQSSGGLNAFTFTDSVCLANCLAFGANNPSTAGHSETDVGTFTVAQVPEPSTVSLTLAGSALLGYFLRRSPWRSSPRVGKIGVDDSKLRFL